MAKSVRHECTQQKPNSDVLDAATADATNDTNEYELDDDELLALAATQLDGS